MAVDPLSSATRAAKRNLLVASTVGIAYRAFDVSISKIPLGGLAIEFDKRLFAFLLLAVLLYLLGTFTLYYFIDIRNVEEAPHLLRAKEAFTKRTGGFHEIVARRILRKMHKALPPDVVVTPHSENQIAMALINGPHPSLLDSKGISEWQPSLVLLHKKQPPQTTLTRDASGELYSIADSVIIAATKSFATRQRWYLRRLEIQLFITKAVYFVRNYITDGFLPIALALVALAALFNIVSLSWLRTLVPLQ